MPQVFVHTDGENVTPEVGTGSPTISPGAQDDKSAHADDVSILRNVSTPRLSATPHDGASGEAMPQVASIEVPVMAAYRQ